MRLSLLMLAKLLRLCGVQSNHAGMLGLLCGHLLRRAETGMGNQAWVLCVSLLLL